MVGHRQQERIVDVGGGAEGRLVDERPEAEPCSGDSERGVLDGDLACAWVEPPGLCSYKLEEEPVSTGPVDHHVQSGPADASTSRLDGFTEGALDLGSLYRAQGMPFNPAQEGEDLIVDEVAHAGGQPGAGEGEFAAFPERMLHDGGNLAQSRGLVVVDLVEGQQQAGATLAEQVGQQLDLNTRPAWMTWASMVSQSS